MLHQTTNRILDPKSQDRNELFKASRHYSPYREHSEERPKKRLWHDEVCMREDIAWKGAAAEREELQLQAGEVDDLPDLPSEHAALESQEQPQQQVNELDALSDFPSEHDVVEEEQQLVEGLDELSDYPADHTAADDSYNYDVTEYCDETSSMAPSPKGDTPEGLCRRLSFNFQSLDFALTPFSKSRSPLGPKGSGSNSRRSEEQARRVRIVTPAPSAKKGAVAECRQSKGFCFSSPFPPKVLQAPKGNHEEKADSAAEQDYHATRVNEAKPVSRKAPPSATATAAASDDDDYCPAAVASVQDQKAAAEGKEAKSRGAQSVRASTVRVASTAQSKVAQPCKNVPAADTERQGDTTQQPSVAWQAGQAGQKLSIALNHSTRLRMAKNRSKSVGGSVSDPFIGPPSTFLPATSAPAANNPTRKHVGRSKSAHRELPHTDHAPPSPLQELNPNSVNGPRDANTTFYKDAADRSRALKVLKANKLAAHRSRSAARDRDHKPSASLVLPRWQF
ncbi:hypothetical protein DIPPA_18252 [Diplonema papillatum]|nr:hypothetical protein DIPPA_18252 [Diplonema papillatum]